MSDLGGEMWNCAMQIRAFSTRCGAPATLCDVFWSRTSPSTISESSTVPPSFLTILMSRRSVASGRAGSITWAVTTP